MFWYGDCHKIPYKQAVESQRKYYLTILQVGNAT
jgi:hypothetical protein